MLPPLCYYYDTGKTTFLNDVHSSYKCIYIRQYHNMRPYIRVSKIPKFDPSSLPYWNIYENEGTSQDILVGGTMAGKFHAGLSGGQRKLLLFELIYQRTMDQSELLIVLDEPFAGVTDDFVPFITERLNLMREKHNILLVTNDHVDTLTKLADNTITVSAIDRSVVRINEREKVDRNKAIAALSIGDEYKYNASSDDLKFFLDVEVASNGDLMGIFIFTVISFAMFLATFWGSEPSSAALVLVAGGIIGFFCINPYLLSLVEWRNAMLEEAEALMHASKGLNKGLKLGLTLFLVIVIATIEYGCVNAVIDGLGDAKYWAAILFDNSSLTFPLICIGIYTKLPFQTAQILGSLPFLLMIFFSTTFSPGAGVEIVKELRYLFARFYFWCIVPGVEDDMEGCPDDLNLVYLILSALLGVCVFVAIQLGLALGKKNRKMKSLLKREALMDEEFEELCVELYGEKGLKRLRHMQSSMNFSSHSRRSKRSDDAEE